MKSETIALLSWIGGGVALTISVTLWLLSAHADQPHVGAVRADQFQQYMENEREWRERLQNEIEEIKRLLNER